MMNVLSFELSQACTRGEELSKDAFVSRSHRNPAPHPSDTETIVPSSSPEIKDELQEQDCAPQSQPLIAGIANHAVCLPRFALLVMHSHGSTWHSSVHSSLLCYLLNHLHLSARKILQLYETNPAITCMSFFPEALATSCYGFPDKKVFSY